jgi:hypothetical protein
LPGYNEEAELMRRKIAVAILAVMISGPLVVAEPTAAQHAGCQAFGQDTADFAQSLGPVFGQNSAGNAPLNDNVEGFKDISCG